MNQEILKLAQIIWDYHQLNHTLEKSDCILVLCSHDPRVAQRGAELFLAGWAPLLIFSGKVGALTEGLFPTSEAEHFAQIAVDVGVPHDHILIEDQATNTGENVAFTRALLGAKGLDPGSFILVQKPYMERRSLATFQRVWPGKRVKVTSPPIAFADYPTPEIPLEQVIEIMVGDLQRIKEYPALGFQVAQEIPEPVWAAFEALVSLGFDGHLIQNSFLS